jgi:hypothetical protein
MKRPSEQWSVIRPQSKAAFGLPDQPQRPFRFHSHPHLRRLIVRIAGTLSDHHGICVRVVDA